MLCPYCKNYRPANEGPCPFCGAPSPLGIGTMDSQRTFYEQMPQQQAPSPPIGQGNRSGSLLKRFYHANTPQDNSPQVPGNDNSLWGQIMAPQAMQAPAQTPNYYATPQQQPSLLPVPYQTGAGMPWQQYPQQQQLQHQQQQQALTILPQGLPTGALVPASSPDASLVPAYPQPEETPIYVPPMYTKPRPIIPRYRAISGLLSVLIVSILLCTGVGLYAKASGKLSFLHVLYGADPRPKSITPTPAVTLPPPKLVFLPGPASNTITSASTASKIDPQTAVPLLETITFKPSESIFLTYSVHPRSPGIVLIKWYTNGLFYESSPPIAIQNNKDTNGYTVIQFAQPLEGWVELYWNNQLAIRLYFVVTN